MGAKEAYEQSKELWEQESEYAETLRVRRNVYATALVIVTGLGVFQITPFIGSDDTYTVTSDNFRWTIVFLVFVSLLLFGIGAFYLYSSGPDSDEEKKIKEQYADEYPDLPPVRRASDLWIVTIDEYEAILAAEDTEASWGIRASKLRVSTWFLSAANRRVSNRIYDAGVLIAWGFIALVLSVMVYIVGSNLRSWDAESTNNSQIQHHKGLA